MQSASAPRPHMRFAARVSAIAILACSTLIASFAVSAHAQHAVSSNRTGDVERLVRASELGMFIETFEGDFLKLWDAPSSNVSAARSQIAKRQVEKYFGSEALRERLFVEMGKLTESVESKRVLAWMSSEAGESLLGRPRTVQTNDLFGVLESYAAENRVAVDRKRVELLARIGREALIDQIYISTSSAAALVVGLTLAAGGEPPEAIPDDAWARLMPGLYSKASESRSRYGQAAAGVLQVEHEHASNDDLRAYLTFRESPEGRWLSKESATAILRVLESQQRLYTENIVRIFSNIH